MSKNSVADLNVKAVKWAKEYQHLMPLFRYTFKKEKYLGMQENRFHR